MVGIRAALLSLLLACALLPAGAASAEEQQKPDAQQELVRLTFGNGWDALPALVALERGFFEREGLLVSSMNITSVQALANSLAGGSTDVAVLPQRTLLVLAAAEAPVKVVAMSGWGSRFDLVARKDLEGVKRVVDLAGKRIAVGTGSEAHPALIRLLNANGMAPTDVRIVTLDADGLVKVLARRDAEAVCASGHFTDRIVAQGDGRYLLKYDKIVEAIGYVGARPLVASNAFLDRFPDRAQRFVTAWIRGLRYLAARPDDAAQILQIFFHRQGVAVGREQALDWVGMTRYDRYYWSAPDVADAKYNGWGLVEGGILKAEPELAGYVDNRFAERALAEIEATASADAGRHTR